MTQADTPNPSSKKIDDLGNSLAHAAMVAVVRLRPAQMAGATSSTREAVCAAMRAKSESVMNQFLDDVRHAPWLGEMSFAAAVLDLANAGVAVLNALPITSQRRQA
jgi:hypothetical protein